MKNLTRIALLIAAIALSPFAAFAQDSEFSGGGSGGGAPAGTVTNNGTNLTANIIPKATGGTTLADSILTSATNLQLTSGLFQFHGATSSFPALKRSTTNLQVRLADDSAFAPISSSTLLLNGSTSGALTLAAAATTTSYTFTWPSAAAGTPSTMFLRGDGTWAVPAGGGSITGSDTHVLYFDGANNPAGDSGFVFNKTTDVATLAGGVNFSADNTATIGDATHRAATVHALVVNGSGNGLTLRSNVAGVIVNLNGANIWQFDLTGTNKPLAPVTDVAYDIGDATHRVLNTHQRNALLYGSTSGALTLAAAATTTSYTFTWPSAAAGTPSTMFLRGDGSWAVPAGGGGFALISEATSPNRVTVDGKLRLGNDQATTSSYESGGGLAGLINYNVPTAVGTAWLGQYNLLARSSSSGVVTAVTEGLRNRVALSGSNNISGAVVGFKNEVESSSTGTLGSVYGGYQSVINTSSTGATALVGEIADLSNAGSGTVSSLIGYDTAIATSAGTITEAIGARLKYPTGAGTITAYRSLALGAPHASVPNTFYTTITPGTNTANLNLTLMTAAPSSNGQPILVSTAGVMSYPTGTPTGAKFLRDDGTWQTAGGSFDIASLSTVAPAAGDFLALADSSNSNAMIKATAADVVDGTAIERVRSRIFWKDDMESEPNSQLSGTPLGGTAPLRILSNIGYASGAVDTAGRQGVIELATGGTSSGKSGFGTANEAYTFGAGAVTYEVAFRVSALSNGTDSYVVYAGAQDQATSSFDQTDGLLVVYDSQGSMAGSTASANYQIVSASNTSRTWQTTSTAVTTGWHKATIVVNAAGTSAQVFIDGTQIGTNVTGTIPTGASRTFGYGAFIWKTAGTTARSLFIDYAALDVALTTAR